MKFKYIFHSVFPEVEAAQGRQSLVLWLLVNTFNCLPHHHLRLPLRKTNTKTPESSFNSEGKKKKKKGLEHIQTLFKAGQRSWNPGSFILFYFENTDGSLCQGQLDGEGCYKN